MEKVFSFRTLQIVVDVVYIGNFFHHPSSETAPKVNKVVGLIKYAFFCLFSIRLFIYKILCD